MHNNIKVIFTNKYVHSIVFIDYENSSALFSQDSADDTLEALDEKLDIMISTVEFFDGKIIRIKGDGIVALFDGLIHHDHAFLALQASREIILKFGQSRKDTILKIRIGIDTGEILLNKIITKSGEFLRATGLATLTAARLETSASPGEILLTEETYKLIPQKENLHYLGERSLKGLKKSPRIFSTLPLDTPVNELNIKQKASTLNFAHHETKQDILNIINNIGSSKIIKLLGDNGTGKSFILNNLHQDKSILAEKLLIKPDKYWKHQPYCLFQIILSQMFSIKPNEKDEVFINTQIKQKVLLSTNQLSTLTKFLQYDPMKSQSILNSDELTDCLRELFNSYNPSYLTLILIDDAKFIDGESLRLFSKIINNFSYNNKLIFILNIDDEKLISNFDIVKIHPLSKKSKLGLFDLDIDNYKIEKDTINTILNVCEDNISHLNLISDHIRTIHKRNNHDESRHLSKSLQVKSIVQSKLSSLNNQTVELIQVTSLYGKKIELKDLMEITYLLGKTFQRNPDSSFNKILVQKNESLFFTNELYRKIISQLIPRKKKQTIHTAILKYLLSLRCNKRDINISAIAYHALRCGNFNRAFKYNIIAARRAYRNHNLDTSKEIYNQLIQLASKNTDSNKLDDIYIKLLLEKISIITMTKKAKQEKKIIKELDDFIHKKQITNPFILNDFYNQKTLHLSQCESTKLAVRSAEKALKYSQKCHEQKRIIKTETIASHVYYHMGQYERALTLLVNKKPQSISKNNPESNIYIRRLNIAAGCQIYHGEFGSAQNLLQDCVKTASNSKNILDLGTTHYFLGLLYRHLGNFIEGQFVLQKTLTKLQETNNYYLRPWLNAELAMITFKLGDSKKAISLLSKSRYEAKNYNLMYLCSLIECYLAEVYTSEHDYESAVKFLTNTINKSLNYHFNGLYAIALTTSALTKFLITKDEFSSENPLIEAEKIARENNMKPLIARIYATRGSILVSTNKALARKYLKKAEFEYSNLGMMNEAMLMTPSTQLAFED